FPQGTYAAIVCDLNNLKRTNDEHGHLEGDTMISIAANTIMNVMPNAYGIYRFGGDEFIALYANVDYNTFRKEQFALTKRGERVVDKRLHEPLSFAVGGAYGEENESLEDVVSRADRSMYAVKGNMKSK
ncbi:MAG: diguanylate cyclase, partial [Lachnospiraceae bacterium]|nr:diguanylate cyclase [Lachnospiraceae bacterium]